MIDSKTKNLADFLSTEIMRQKKQTRRTWLIGIPVVFFVMGYMTWMSYKMKTLVFVPEHIALFIAQGVDREAPRVIADTEKQIIASAPAVARTLNNELHVMISDLELIGTSQVEAVHLMLPHIDSATKKAIDDYFMERGEEVKKTYELHGADQFASEIVRTIFKNVNEDLKSRVQLPYNETVARGPAAVSLAFLSKIHEHLDALASKNVRTMSESERLERRVILSWANAVGAHFKLKFHE